MAELREVYEHIGYPEMPTYFAHLNDNPPVTGVTIVNKEIIKKEESK